MTTQEVVEDLVKQGQVHQADRYVFSLINRALNDWGYMGYVHKMTNDIVTFEIKEAR